MEQPKRALSASSIKSLETCSWLYYCQYEKKLPQKTNEGALRGTSVHTVFEVLLNPRHKHHYDAIMSHGSIEGSPAIKRLVIKNLRKDKILTTTNYDMMDAMIMVGLRTDFFGHDKHLGKSGRLGPPEYRFEIVSETPKYRIRGYIDKIIFYDDGTLKIIDYKSSKQKFSGDDLTANVQAMAYSLAGYKLLNAKDVTAEFIFVRFPRQPRQTVHLTQQELKGFEHYLAHVYSIVTNFNEKHAKSNMAAFNDKNRWLCKAGKWECPYLKSFSYYALMNPDGTIARTSFENNMEAQPGQKLEILQYDGCPPWKRKAEL